MNSPIKIILSGKMGSGKTTAVKILEKMFRVKEIALATPIKEIMDYAQTKCGFEKIKDRKFLQFIGTDWARAIDPEIWIKQACLAAESDDNAAEIIIISDVRFKDEYATFKSKGWKSIRIINRGGDISEIGSSHISECDLDDVKDWDYVISNSGSIKDYETTLINAVNTIKAAVKTQV